MTALRARLPVAFCAAAMPVAAGAGAAPEAELWERWTAHDPASTETIDHSAWDGILERFVAPGPDGVARFAYAAAARDRAALDAYVDSLARTPVSRYARPEQMAYWINLYNALTVQVVLDRYPVESIRDIDISPGLFSDGPWGAKLVEAEGEALSLDDIEHRILRPVWRDARVHYAVNCASIGCPQLTVAAWTGAALEAQLEAAARAYVNHPRGVSVTENGRLRLSKIYDWFAEDFGGRDGLAAHLLRFAAPELAAVLAGAPRIAGYEYDWALNDAPAPPEDGR